MVNMEFSYKYNTSTDTHLRVRMVGGRCMVIIAYEGWQLLVHIVDDATTEHIGARYIAIRYHHVTTYICHIHTTWKYDIID